MGKYGRPLRRTTENTSVNTARYRMGFSIDHATPRTEDLYLTLTSLRTRFARICRAAHNSRTRTGMESRGGSEVRTMTSVVAAVTVPFVRLRWSAGHVAKV